MKKKIKATKAEKPIVKKGTKDKGKGSSPDPG